jgi:lipopolysaccharide transport system ATP-binding protein
MTPLTFENVGKCYKMKSNENFWALRHFSLDVNQGDIVGIIGSNGAGKSTLLKICARVILPTEGRVDILGKSGALLEVGTGFHPELTGLENIYFNGAILGIPRKEINDKLDDIIKFAGIEQFIDTPVKRYSSGMYTRLAFAIASQLDVENMFIDEVLAVGDAEFQQRSLSRMNNMAKSGRTILFISHDMNSIARLCNRVVWLDHGEMKMVGEPKDVIQAYIQKTVPRGDIVEIQQLLDQLPDDPAIKLTNINIIQKESQHGVYFRDYPISITISYTIKRKEHGLRLFARILDDGNLVMRSYHNWENNIELEHGDYQSTLTIPPNLLAHRNYELSVGALVFNQRACTGNIGEGIRIPITIETVSPIDSYPEEAYTYRPMIEPILKWRIQEV